MNRVLILGATSAIAQEVALLHDARGDELCLVGRNEEKLAALSARCKRQHRAFSADFMLLRENERVVARALAELQGLDSVLIAHGDLGNQLATEKDFAAAEAVLCTNLLSVISLLIPLANHLETARAGRIGVITSVAGDRGRPRNYTYGAAKGALNIYLQGLRTRLYPRGVSVTTLKLGPVDTPMTRDHQKHPLFGRPDRVARDIVHAIDARVPEAYVPYFWRAIMAVVRTTPEQIFQRVPFLSGR